MGKVSKITNEKKKPTFFSMLHYWMKKKYPKGVFLVKFYTGSMGDFLHYPEVFEGFKDYDEAFDYVEKKGFLNHEDYILKIYVDGKKSKEGDELIEGKTPVGSKRYVYSAVDRKVNNKKGKYDFLERHDTNSPSGKSCYIVFKDKSYITFISFDDVNLSYSAKEKHWGLAEDWKLTKESQEKIDIKSKAKHIILYSSQHDSEFEEFVESNLLSYDQLLDTVTSPKVQACINLHMLNKSIGDDKENPKRKSEIKYLIDGSPDGWNSCLGSIKVIELALKDGPIVDLYSLLRENYITNLVEL